VRFGLGEDVGKAAENLQEGGDGDVIEGHGMLFSLLLPRPALRGERVGVRGTIREAGIN
jgi:hypothetical protein